MPEYPQEITQAVAEVLLRQYDSEFDASHLRWQDFVPAAREVLDVAAPLLDEAIRRTGQIRQIPPGKMER